MKRIFSYGNFDHLTRSWTRIRYTVARGLNPSKFLTISLSKSFHSVPGILTFYPMREGFHSSIDRIVRALKIWDFIGLNSKTRLLELAFPNPRIGIGLYSYLNAIKGFHVDIFHSSAQPVCPKIYQLLKRQNPKLKLIQTFYGFQPTDIFHYSGYYLAKKADVVTAVSKFTAKCLEKYYKVQAKVIYDGVDINLFKPMPHENKRPRILYVGHLLDSKRPEYIVQLSKIFPECDFIFKVGGVQGQYRSLLHQKFKNLKFILKPMFHPELAPVYANSDIFLFPSLVEGFPNAMLEAAACGLPLIVSEAPCFREFVQHSSNGYRCANFREFASYLRFLLDNPADRLKLGKNARKKAEQFSWERIIPKYEEIFDIE